MGDLESIWRCHNRQMNSCETFRGQLVDAEE
jgi:hypothetical protein